MGKEGSWEKREAGKHFEERSALFFRKKETLDKIFNCQLSIVNCQLLIANC